MRACSSGSDHDPTGNVDMGVTRFGCATGSQVKASEVSLITSRR